LRDYWLVVLPLGVPELRFLSRIHGVRSCGLPSPRSLITVPEWTRETIPRSNDLFVAPRSYGTMSPPCQNGLAGIAHRRKIHSLQDLGCQRSCSAVIRPSTGGKDDLATSEQPCIQRVRARPEECNRGCVQARHSPIEKTALHPNRYGVSPVIGAQLGKNAFHVALDGDFGER
jgi:hypothetical protein